MRLLLLAGTIALAAAMSAKPPSAPTASTAPDASAPTAP
jgi:hypothetical protein